jgi:hypothetical protein
MYSRLVALSYMANILPYYGDHEHKLKLVSEVNPDLIKSYPLLFVPPIFKNAWVDNLFKNINEELYMKIKVHIPNLNINIHFDKIQPSKSSYKLYRKNNIVGGISNKTITLY